MQPYLWSRQPLPSHWPSPEHWLLLDAYLQHTQLIAAMHLGCRHISFYAFGPDFKQDYSMGEEHEMIDIPATIAELLHFDLPDGKGRIMQELFK